MKDFGLFLAVLAAAAMANKQDFLNDEWESFKEKYEKSYISAEEEARRKLLFEQNLELIIENNERYENGNITYKLAMNRFGDMLPSEITPEAKFACGKKASLEAQPSPEVSFNITDLPGQVYWSKKRAAASVPGQKKLKRRSVGPTILPYAQIPEGTLTELVATVGPICVDMNGARRDFTLYSKGVYPYSKCLKDDSDHTVILVNYGTIIGGGKYWLVKNSWGLDWGERGYFRMSPDFGNGCVP